MGLYKPDAQLRRTLERALPVFRAYVGQDDDEALIAALVSAGLGRPLAGRIVAFLPLAFTRVFFAKSKVAFADTYLRVLPDGSLGPEQPLEDEPVYREALALARTQAGSQALLAVAIRSPAFRALNQAMRQGQRLDKLGVAPALLFGLEPEAS